MAKNKHPMYGYTIDRDANPTLDDQSGEKFDEKGLRSNRAQLVTAREPDRKAMRFLGMEDESKMNLGEDFDINKAGAGRAGRGKPGGPSAKELQKYESKNDSMTAGQKQSMQDAKDEEMRKKMKTAPTTKTEMGKGFAKGGSASSRADGCAQRGKTRGKIIK